MRLRVPVVRADVFGIQEAIKGSVFNGYPRGLRLCIDYMFRGRKRGIDTHIQNIEKRYPDTS